MPSKIHDALSRQWELLKLLPSRGNGKTARELSMVLDEIGFSVTKRTIERDLKELMSHFPIECNNRSTPFGWRWIKNSTFDIPGLTLYEAMSMKLMEEYLKPLIPASYQRVLQPRFDLASKKLDTDGSSKATAWSEKVKIIPPGITLIPPIINQRVLDNVQEALFRDEQLQISYHAIGSNIPSEQIVHPLGLVQRGPVTYLIATAFLYSDVRVYAVHRMISAERISEPCNRPENFSLKSYLETGGINFSDGAVIRLKAKISEYLARILGETPLASDMKIVNKEDERLLTCSIVNSGQLLWWIRSLGDNIEIVAPKKLRKAVIDGIISLNCLYNYK